MVRPGTRRHRRGFGARSSHAEFAEDAAGGHATASVQQQEGGRGGICGVENFFFFWGLTWWWGNVVRCGAETHKMSTEPTSSEVKVTGSLVGRFDHRLDPKRRLTIPSLWFECLGGPRRVAVMRSRTGDACLEVFTEEEQMARMKHFEELSRRDRSVKDFMRAVSENTEILPVDSQNRIRISDNMLRHAKISPDDTQVVLLGMAGHFELWSLAEKPLQTSTEPAGYEDWVKKAMEIGF